LTLGREGRSDSTKRRGTSSVSSFPSVSCVWGRFPLIFHRGIPLDLGAFRPRLLPFFEIVDRYRLSLLFLYPLGKIPLKSRKFPIGTAEWGIPSPLPRVLPSESGESLRSEIGSYRLCLLSSFRPALPFFRELWYPADRAREPFPYLGSERDRLCFAFSFPSLSVESTIPKGLPAESGESLRSEIGSYLLSLLSSESRLCLTA